MDRAYECDSDNRIASYLSVCVRVTRWLIIITTNSRGPLARDDRFNAAKLLLELEEEERSVAILEDINEEHDMNPDGACQTLL